MSMMAPDGAVSDAAIGMGSGIGLDESVSGSPTMERSTIETAYLSLTSSAPQDAALKADELVTQAGGFVQDSSWSPANEYSPEIAYLTVRVPADNVDLVGVRDVVDSAGLDRVFNVLRQPYTEEPTNWSRRYKANLEKLASGDVIKVAEVVRDLYRRDLDRGLSAGEKRMLAKAKQILISELALAERTDEEKAATLLDEVLAS
jgi:CarD family transcriptional regulator